MRRCIAWVVWLGLALTGIAQADVTGQIIVSLFEDGTNHLYTVRPDGSDMTRLDLGLDDIYAGSIAASPDGRYLVFSRWTSSDDVGASVDLYLYDFQTHALTAVTTDSPAVAISDYRTWVEDWSPDSRRFLIYRSGYHADNNVHASILEYDLAADKSTVLVSLTWDDGYGLSSPSYAPDGSQIVFSAGDGLLTGEPGDSMVENIYVMNSDGADLRRLTSSGSRNFAPQWSPDGTHIAFTSSRSDNDDLFVMNADGSGQTQLTLNPADDFGGRWSPDGATLVFLSNRSSPTSFGFDYRHDLYALPLGGSSAARLTRTQNVQDFALLPGGEVVYSTIGAEDIGAGLSMFGVGGDPTTLLNDLPTNHHVSAITWRADS